MSTALLVIDVQESFRHRPYFEEADVAAFLQQQQALIDGATRRGIPVIQILHVEDEGPFALASGHVRTMEPLRIKPAKIFQKHRHSALVGTGLDVWLVKQGINSLVVSGIRTEQCCETTTRHASDLGFAVTYVTEATLTFAMNDPAGRRVGAAEIKARTEMVLKTRFARIATVADAFDDAEAAIAA